MGFATSPPHHDESEEEMLRRAIAMSLEEQEELPFGTGLILKDDNARLKGCKGDEVGIFESHTTSLEHKNIYLKLIRKKWYSSFKRSFG